jgi:hypothetical protein
MKKKSKIIIARFNSTVQSVSICKPITDSLIMTPDECQICSNEDNAVEPIQIMDYLVVDCLPEIGRHFYLGDHLLHINENTTPTELIEAAIDMYGEGPDAVLPGLKAKIETLIGKDNFQFLGWEIGREHLTLTWLVDMDVYDEAVELISGWLWYEEIHDIVNLDWRL